MTPSLSSVAPQPRAADNALALPCAAQAVSLVSLNCFCALPGWAAVCAVAQAIVMASTLSAVNFFMLPFCFLHSGEVYQPWAAVPAYDANIN